MARNQRRIRSLRVELLEDRAMLSLVAAYAFNEGTGTKVADASGTGNVGTATSATWSTSGKNAGALSFNGTSSIVNIPDSASLHLSTGMTLEAWVRPTSVTKAWRDVIYKGNDIYFLEATSTTSSRPAGGITVGSSDALTYGTAALAVNTWTHLALTYDGANLRLYVNGAQVSSAARTGTISSSTNALQIGGDNIYSQRFAGLIDDVRIYNNALTAAQIQTDMNTPVSATQTPPDTTPPLAPASLTATPASTSQINLSWAAANDNVAVTGYRVERQDPGSTTFTQIATTTGTTFSNTGLAVGATYSYRVQGVDAAGNLGAYSPVATATTQADTTAPTVSITAPAGARV